MDTDDATYNNSGTYPDGTKITTSPGGGTTTAGAVGERRTTLTYDYYGPGINFDSSSWISPSYEPQGVAYNADKDRVYVSEVTDTVDDPSTIHEYKTDGTKTGTTFQLPNESPDPNHTASFEWHNGFIWALDFNSDKIYKVDWDNSTVDGSFDIGGGTIASNSPTAMTFVPTSDDVDKLLVSFWSSPNATLINPDDAVSDGSASGNEYQSLTNGIVQKIQGLQYRDGYLYLSLHEKNTWKAALPFADQLDGNYGLTSHNIVWSFGDGVLDVGQDLTYDGNKWYKPDENNGVHRGPESMHERAFNGHGKWSLTDGGPGTERVLQLDAGQASDSGEIIKIVTNNPIAASVEVWYYDDTETSSGNGKKAWTAASQGGQDQRLGVNTAQTNGDSNFYWYNNTDGWTDTGVSRPNNAQWVKFGWMLTGSECLFSISKDGGRSWSDAGSTTNQGTDIGGLIVGCTEGTAQIGPWHIEPIY